MVGGTETRVSRARHRGFTLVELLVGLTLLAVMALVLYSAFWLGMRSWSAAAAHYEETEEIRLAVAFLRGYVSKAYPLLRREETEQRLQFEGDEHRLRFVTDMAPHLGIAGLYTVVVELVESAGERELIATRSLLYPDLEPSGTEAAQFTQRAVLARRLGEARFAYFGTPATGDSSQSDDSDQWQDQWSDAQRLPKLVSLEVTPKVGAPWPRLVLRLHVDGIRRDAAAPARHESLESSFPGERGDLFRRPLVEPLTSE